MYIGVPKTVDQLLISSQFNIKSLFDSGLTNSCGHHVGATGIGNFSRNFRCSEVRQLHNGIAMLVSAEKNVCRFYVTVNYRSGQAV